MMKQFSSFAAALAMVATPVAASAAPVNPAASLSLAPRAGSATGHSSQLAGGGIIFAVIGIGILAAGLIVALDDNSAPRSP